MNRDEERLVEALREIRDSHHEYADPLRMMARHVLARTCRDGTVAEGHDADGTSWRCTDCNCINRDHEAFCFRCGAGQPEFPARLRDGTVAVDHEQLRREVEQLRAHDDERVELAQEVGKLRAEVARSRDGTVAVEDVVEALREAATTLHNIHKGSAGASMAACSRSDCRARAALLAAFSPASIGDRPLSE